MADAIDPKSELAPSISPAAAAILRPISAALAAMPPREPAKSVADFDAAAARGAAFAEQMGAAPIAALAPDLREWSAHGTTVLTVTPRTARRGAAPLVYIHGGGFVSGSARANLLTAAVAADTSGRVVHSIDYTLAPHADWRAILAQVTAAWDTIAADSAAAPGLFGDSAGGCIAAAATLALRGLNATLPAALLLMSPVVDLAGGGDTNRTLAYVDYLDPRMLAPALRAYAPEADWTNPLVSPIYGDFAAGYPPTLIQVGTRELLLSDAVRLHRALRAAGRSSRLEVYEGMPHVFQPLLASAPEGREAWAEIAAFWSEHLA